MRNKTLSKSLKPNIYKTITRPVVIYAAKILTMTKKDKADLRIAKRRILRTTYGPVKIASGEYRTRRHNTKNQTIENKIAWTCMAGRKISENFKK